MTMAASAVKRSSTSSVPKLPCSSSATHATMTSPRSGRSVAFAAATIMAAMPPFMSNVPRPNILPFSMRGCSGSPS